MKTKGSSVGGLRTLQDGGTKTKTTQETDLMEEVEERDNKVELKVEEGPSTKKWLERFGDKRVDSSPVSGTGVTP